jgi:hypothetical protein
MANSFTNGLKKYSFTYGNKIFFYSIYLEYLVFLLHRQPRILNFPDSVTGKINGNSPRNTTLCG